MNTILPNTLVRFDEEVILSTRFNAMKGSIVQFGNKIKACGGHRITFVPISGIFKMTVHSSFFKNSKKSLNGGIVMEINALKDAIGLEEFEYEDNLYDGYHSLAHKCEII